MYTLVFFSAVRAVVLFCDKITAAWRSLSAKNSSDYETEVISNLVPGHSLRSRVICQ